MGKQELDGSSSVYKKRRKAKLAREGKINCARCPYHRVENVTRVKFFSKVRGKRQADKRRRA